MGMAYGCLYNSIPRVLYHDLMIFTYLLEGDLEMIKLHCVTKMKCYKQFPLRPLLKYHHNHTDPLPIP